MIKELCLGCLVIFLIGLSAIVFPFQEHPSLTPTLARKMGLQIWQNECAGKKEGLTTWNSGEEFASLGIGHFIWYPAGVPQKFKQSFPDLVIFFQSHGIHLPPWVKVKECPWQTREEFQNAQMQSLLTELRELLAQHVDLQTLFMVQRLDRALPVLLNHVSKGDHPQVSYQFFRLAHTPGGIFALLDYLNFKGEGIAEPEHYKGEGWGLLQVLLRMQGIQPGMPAIEEFIDAAKQVLTQRVKNSPQERGEARWLKGWHHRIEGYRRISIMLEQE